MVVVSSCRETVSYTHLDVYKRQGLVLGGGLLVFGRQFLALFTTEEAVIDAGMKRITVMALAYCCLLYTSL